MVGSRTVDLWEIYLNYVIGLNFNITHKHRILPDLKWVSDNSRARISCVVATEAENWCWLAISEVPEWDEDLLSRLRRFDFRYIRADELHRDWCGFVNRLWEVVSSVIDAILLAILTNTPGIIKDYLNDIIRTDPRNEVDLRLLELLKSMIEPVLSSRPARFPLNLVCHFSLPQSISHI